MNPNTILFVSHREQQCGIYQYAINLLEVLQRSSLYSFVYAECSNEQELDQAIKQIKPAAIIYNYYPATMPWLSAQTTQRYGVPQLGVMHEVTQKDADEATQEMFDFHLCPDPTLVEKNPSVFKTGRIVPSYVNTESTPDIVTIGSFGFGVGDKGFERLIETVQREFEVARIILNLPFNDIVDKEGTVFGLATAERCRNVVNKPGIELIIRHEFLSKPELLNFLALNTLNAFFYDPHKHRGISSTIEYALAVQRPIAITKCGMFRHVFSANPSICIEDSTLKQIISNGIAPLLPFYEAWSEANFLKDYERILNDVFSRYQVDSASISSPLGIPTVK